MSEKILIVEDEEKLSRYLELELNHEGYTVNKAFDGNTGLSMATEGEFDLILLDIMLPGINGLEVLRRLQAKKQTPVILLTARDAVMDKVSGLDAGAVDYITKPFAIEELLARIRVALKLHAPASSSNNENSLKNASSAYDSEDTYTWGELRLNEKSRQVYYGHDPITLSNREFIMLETFLKNKDIVLSRETLLESVCGYDYFGETNVIDVYVRYLRTKIDDKYGVKMIETVRGVGYVIRSDNN